MSGSGKPTRIEATYTSFAHYTVSKIELGLGIDWVDVDSYYIKHGNLLLCMNDGRVLEYEDAEWGETDTKRPDEIWEYGANFSKNVLPHWRKSEVVPELQALHIKGMTECLEEADECEDANCPLHGMEAMPFRWAEDDD